MAPAPVKDEDVAAEDSLAVNRSRRDRKGKNQRLAALQKYKQAKTGKNKYEDSDDDDNLYDVVDEDEYSKIVQQRQEDDWIVDDDGGGYVEDGREIFDDDLDEGDAYTAKAKKAVADRKKSKNPNIMKPGTKPKTTIRSMFMAQSGVVKKRPEKDASIQDDDILGDIMSELHQKPSASSLRPSKVAKKPMSEPAKAPYNPFSTKVTPTRSRTLKLMQPRIMTNDMNSTVSVKPKMPKKTALTELQDSIAIEQFDSQDVAETEVDINGSEDTEMLEEPKPSMDVGDIDFDDDFGEECEPKREIKEEKPAISEENLSSGWETIRGSPGNQDVLRDVVVDSSKLPLSTNADGEQVLRFYWLDAYEEPYKQPGTVFLFGKVWIESAKAHVSCCVHVQNIERRLFLLPRSHKMNLKSGETTEEPVSLVDVYQEFNKLSEKYKIDMFKSRKVTKEYCFELADVPVESDYMEIRYSAKLPAVPTDLKGETFSHVFGANTSSLELFFMDRKMKGPSWLEIKTPQLPSPGVSWCKVEATVSNPESVLVLKDFAPPPPLVTMTISMRTLPNPKTHQNEVIAVGCLVHQQFHMDKPAPKVPFQSHFCAISKPSDCIFPFDFRDKVQAQSKTTKIEIMGTERALLGFLLAKIHKLDPDLIVGHDVYSFDLDVLLHRLNANKIPHWSRLGRLKRANMPKMSGGPGKGGFVDKSAACGRLVCDIKISARELIRCRAYDLTELSNHIIKVKRSEVDLDDIKNMYSASNDLLRLIELTLVDATYILRIMYELNVIPLALQITNICGNVMARTMMGGRSERNEFLLLHAFKDKNFIVPDKSYKKKTTPHEEEGDEDHDVSSAGKKGQGRRKPAYAGGLVLEPKKGFYDKYILLLDFNSLYPSIIQEYNICFTTISRNSQNNKEDTEEEEDWHLELPDPDLEPGILPTEIRKLVESRKQVKKLMKAPDLSPEMYMQYDIRQKALKLTANSMYGCLGFSHSRFYAKPLAALVTGKGREILMKTKDLVQAMNLDVIYGDTDSIMINTNSTDMDEVFKLGNKVKQEVNKLYKLLEIDIDGVFKSMLLLKKKKYAALNITKVGDRYEESKELKGLDIVRRDWCELAKAAGNFVVDQILSGAPCETIVENIHSKLIEVGEEVANGKVPAEMFYITKSLTKNPEDYPDRKSLPHVQVAMRLNSKGGKKMKGGDTVYYVVCEDGSSLPASQRAYHPDELSKQDNLKIDTKYYLSNQVHPVVARLCDPIDGTDAAHIAECLGLDPSGYKHAARQQDEAEEDAMVGAGEISDEEKYKDCDRLKINCRNPDCKREIILDGVFKGDGAYIECSLAKCPNPQCTTRPADNVTGIANKITLAIKKHIKTYYEGWMKCEDSACHIRTRKIPLVFNRGHPVCQTCHRGTLHVEYSESALYNQLCFYRYIFDLEKAKKNLKKKDESLAARISEEYKPQYLHLKNVVDQKLKQSAYSQVNLGRIFEGLSVTKK